MHFPAGRAALAFGVVLFTAAAPPQAASAGTYDVESCRANEGGSLATRAWKVEHLGLRRSGFQATNSCAAGDAMRGVLRGNRTLRRDAGAQFVFRAPGNATLTRLFFARQLVVAPDLVYQLFAVVGRTGQAVPLERCFGSGCATVSSRPPFNGALPNGTRAVVARLSCRPANERVCRRRPGGQLFGLLRVTRSVVSVEDIRSPVFVRPPEGELVSPAAGQTGVRRLRIEASDAGGGLRSLSLVVDGQEVVTFPFSSRAVSGCGTVLNDFDACPKRSRRSFDFDTARLSNGAHELVVRVRDAGGNRTDSAPLLISTNNATSPGVYTRLTAGLGSSGESVRRPSRKLRYGTPATLAGFVTDAAGVAIPNAPVRITPRIGGPGGAAQPFVETATDAAGRYSVPVPVGPSRSFEVRSFTDGRLTAATRAELAVTVPVRLRAARAGSRVVRLRGSIPADPRPAEGVAVEIQAKAGKRFVPFRVLRTNSAGAFALNYRFRGRGSFVLRAVVKRQGGLPFATGRSPAKRFRVR